MKRIRAGAGAGFFAASAGACQQFLLLEDSRLVRYGFESETGEEPQPSRKLQKTAENLSFSRCALLTAEVPTDILLLIIKHTGPRWLGRLSQTCARLESLVRHWRRLWSRARFPGVVGSAGDPLWERVFRTAHLALSWRGLLIMSVVTRDTREPDASSSSSQNPLVAPLSVSFSYPFGECPSCREAAWSKRVTRSGLLCAFCTKCGFEAASRVSPTIHCVSCYDKSVMADIVCEACRTLLVNSEPSDDLASDPFHCARCSRCFAREMKQLVWDKATLQVGLHIRSEEMLRSGCQCGRLCSSAGRSDRPCSACKTERLGSRGKERIYF